MRKILFSAFIFWTCSVHAQYNFTINGQIDNSVYPSAAKVNDGDTIMLKFINIDRTDFAVIRNNQFCLQGTVPYPSVAMIEHSYGGKLILLDNSTYNYQSKLTELENKNLHYITTICTQSSFYRAWRVFQDTKHTIYKEKNDIANRLERSDNKDSISYYRKKIREIDLYLNETYWKFSNNQANKYAVAYIAPSAPDFSYEKYHKVYDILPNSVKQSFYGKNFLDYLTISREGISNKIDKDVVDKMPEMTLVNTNLNKIVLDRSFYSRNNYTIIDFWASWCAPCRKTNVDYKALHNELKERKIAIIGFSTDNNLDSWKKAVEEDSLNWLQVSDLKGEKSPVTAFLNIQFIPANIIIDSSGNIVGRNIKVSELSEFFKSRE